MGLLVSCTVVVSFKGASESIDDKLVCRAVLGQLLAIGAPGLVQLLPSSTLLEPTHEAQAASLHKVPGKQNLHVIGCLVQFSLQCGLRGQSRDRPSCQRAQ